MSHISFLYAVPTVSEEKSTVHLTFKVGIYGALGMLSLFNCYLYEQVFYELTIKSFNSVNRPYEWIVIIIGSIFSGILVPCLAYLRQSWLQYYRKLIFGLLVVLPSLFVGLIGYTNISLYLGHVLHVSTSVQKADVIVVANKGNFPFRGHLAAQLYHKGLAKKMVVFVRDIPLNTDYLQGELRVPKSDVIWARDKINNTYIEAVITKQLVEQYGWQSILLVTDSYQMLRLLKTFKKQGIQNLHPVSVPWNSLIESPTRLLGWGYRPLWNVPLEELDDSTRYLFRHTLTIKILHEYAGIIFYTLMGYL